MGLVAKKPVFRGLRTTQAQTSLSIHAFQLAPLLFIFWKVGGDWFETCFVRNPEDRFSPDVAQIVPANEMLVLITFQGATS